MAHTPSLSLHKLQSKRVVVLDVRNDYEWDAGHFKVRNCSIPSTKNMIARRAQQWFDSNRAAASDTHGNAAFTCALRCGPLQPTQWLLIPRPYHAPRSGLTAPLRRSLQKRLWVTATMTSLSRSRAWTGTHPSWYAASH